MDRTIGYTFCSIDGFEENDMTEHKLIKERITEKSKLKKAQRQMVRLFVASSSMIFGTLLLVWMIQSTPETSVPGIYLISSLIIIVSSIFVYYINKAIRSDEIRKAVYFTSVSIALGTVFIVTQYLGWNQMLDLNQQFKNILLPFTVIHFVHTVVGIGLLMLVLVRLKEYRIHSRAADVSSNIFYFWHFLGIIWLSFVGVMA